MLSTYFIETITVIYTTSLKINWTPQLLKRIYELSKMLFVSYAGTTFLLKVLEQKFLR